MMDILKTLLRFDDKSKPETIKKPVYLVDIDIRRLVSCMNLNEYKTYASCQGHSFPVDNVPPYIAFRAKVHKAAALEGVLRQDAESASPILRWGWDVTASFDGEFELCFRLSPSRPHRWHYRFLRSSFIADFRGLRSMVKLATKMNISTRDDRFSRG
jgi:hypothetical protein